ncbi:MAG TPA: SMP-30/gluconolactonase/LRE family protein [Thermoguttaceae bacterium]|nr:SMP-30/gluconolactonase/LRE family protein [Thermoguttaceae bacterium]
MKRMIRTLVALLSLGVISPAAGGAEADADLPPSRAVEPELYATGFELAAGPVLDSAGNLFVANYRGNGNIGLIMADGTAGVFCDLREAAPAEGREPRANGLKIDSQGRLIAADAGAGRLLRIAADGKNVEVLADRWEGKRFNHIYDVALDPEGNIYFSDPGSSRSDEPTGSVYRYDIGTTKVSQIATGLVRPTGLAVTPDKKHFCLAESGKFRVLIWDMEENGQLSNGRVLINFPTENHGEIVGGEFAPEGMIFDTAGRLYVAMDTAEVVNVVEVPSGELIRQYAVEGSRVTNCHFHGGYLYVTVAAKEAVFRLELGVEGFRYNQPEEP